MPLSWVFLCYSIDGRTNVSSDMSRERWATCFIVGRPIFLSQSVHYCPLMSTTNGHDYGISKAYYERSVHLSTSFLYKRGFKKYIYTTIKELFLWTSGQNSEKGLRSKVIYVHY